MPISPFTFPPNPTFGNPFNTEAVVQNTLNTAMKANLTLLQTYYNTTGWEEQYLANQSVTSRQLYPQASNAVFRTTNVTLSTFNATFVSDQITITTTFNNAVIMWNYNFFVETANPAGAPFISEAEHWLERGSSGFSAGTGTAILPTSGTKPTWRLGDDVHRNKLSLSYCVFDTLGVAGNYYYRFTADENQATSKAIVIGEQSWYSYIVLNGIN